MCNHVYNLIKKYWPVFDTNRVFVPVKNYKCVIDTGDSPPIAVKKILYGPKEAHIMRKAIAALKKLARYVRLRAVTGYSKPSLLPSRIRSMYGISKILSVAYA